VRHVAFDEAGNTGNDLVTPDQPVFCLASVCVEQAEIAAVAKLLARVRTAEWKFSKLRRNPGQLKLLRELLEMDWVTPDRVKLFVIFKRYMAIAKLVDLIHEPSAREFGIDLYERGAARAAVNLLTMTMPVYLGRTRVDRLVNLFVQVVRRRDQESLERFHAECVAAYEYVERKFPDTIGDWFPPIILACRRPESWIPHLSRTELDPIVPSYYTLCDAWGKTLNERFVVLADESKTLARERDFLLRFADEQLREQSVGSPARNIEFPLKVTDIVTTPSHASQAVQIADLFAGIGAYAFAPMANNCQPDDVARAFADKITEKVWVDGLIPTPAVTPEALGMEDYVGCNPVDYSTRILAGDPTVRK
jgi:uncharacterized protein DUF3800